MDAAQANGLVPSDENVAKLLVLLQDTLIPDSEKVKKAERELHNVSKHPEVLLLLVRVLTLPSLPASATANLAGVRNLAAVILRRVIQTHWSSPVVQQEAVGIKDVLLSQTSTEQIRATRNALLSVVVAIVREDIDHNMEWPELFQVLLGQGGSNQVCKYSLSNDCKYTLLQQLSENSPESLFSNQSNTSTVIGIVMSGLAVGPHIANPSTLQQDNPVAICLSAVKIFRSFVRYSIEQDLLTQQAHILPPCLGKLFELSEFLREFLGTDHGKHVDGADMIMSVIFELMTDLAESPSTIMKPYFKPTLDFALIVLCSPNHSIAMRSNAVEFIAIICEAKPRTVVKMSLAGTLVEAAFRLALEAEEDATDQLAASFYGKSTGANGENKDAIEEEEDGGDDDIEPTPLYLSFVLMSSFATGVKPKLAFELSFQYLQKVLADPSIALTRKAHCLAMFSCIIEGSFKEVSSKISFLYDYFGQLYAVVSVNQSKEANRLKRAVLTAFSQLSNVVDVGGMSDSELQAIQRKSIDLFFSALSTSSPHTDDNLHVRVAACSFLEIALSLFDTDESIEQILVPCLGNLLTALAMSAAGNQAIVTAASLAEVAKDVIANTETCHAPLGQLLEAVVAALDPAKPASQDQGHRNHGSSSRAAAIDAAASILVCLSNNQDKLNLVLGPMVERVLHALVTSPEDSEITRSVYVFFAKLCDTLGGQFSIKYAFPIVATFASKSCVRDDGVFKNSLGKTIRDAELEQDGIEPLNILVNEEDDIPATFAVRSMYLDEKEAAAGCLGSLFGSLGDSTLNNAFDASIAPLFKEALEALFSAQMYFHEEVRAEAISSLARLLCATRNPVLSKVLLGNEGPSQLTEQIVGACVDLIRSDDSASVVADAMRALTRISNELHIFGIYPCFLNIQAVLMELIQGKTLVSLLNTVEEENDSDTDEEKKDQSRHGKSKQHAYVGGIKGNRAGVSNADPEEDPDEESEELEKLVEVIDAFVELVPSLSKSCRVFFSEVFLNMAQELLSSVYPRYGLSDKAQLMGMLAESLSYLNTWPIGSAEEQQQLRVIAAAHPVVPPFNTDAYVADTLGPVLIPFIHEALKEKISASLQRNSVYLLGVLFQCSSQTSRIWTLLPPLLPSFEKLLDRSKVSDGAVTDNAAGCIGRILSTVSSEILASLRISESNMAQAMLGAVPLQDDPSEIHAVCRGLLAFVARNRMDAFLLLEMMHWQSIEGLVQCLLIKREEKESGTDSDGIVPMLSVTDDQAMLIVDVLKELRSRCGDKGFAKLDLSPDERDFIFSLLT